MVAETLEAGEGVLLVQIGEAVARKAFVAHALPRQLIPKFA